MLNTPQIKIMTKKSSKNFFSNDKKFENLKRTKFGFERKIKFSDIKKYANLVGDKNPLHLKQKILIKIVRVLLLAMVCLLAL